METRKTETIQAMQSIEYSPPVVALIESRKDWQQLIHVGTFEEEKAQLSLQITPDHIKELRHRSTRDAIAAAAPSLATIKKYQGRGKMIAVLAYTINTGMSLLNIKNKPNGEQVIMISEILFDDYYFLTTAEIKLIIINGVKGLYGKIFERVDLEILSDWFAKYSESRAATVDAVRKNKHKGLKKEENAIPMPDYIKKMIAKERQPVNEKTETLMADPNFNRFVREKYETLSLDEKKKIPFANFLKLEIEKARK